jgi:apolipoprotein D and lipocalin family protein
MNRLLYSFVFLIIFLGEAICQKPQFGSTADIQKFSGRWFVIASFSDELNPECRCSTAEYTVIPRKRYVVCVSRCIILRNGKSRILHRTGKSYFPRGTGNIFYRLQYVWPFSRIYFILDLAGDYSWILAGNPDKKYFLLLSRESYMPTDTYNTVISLAKKLGYDPRKIRKTPQNCDIIP